MKPFALKQHDKDSTEVRALRAEELTDVAGGQKAPKLNTITVTPSGGGDDGADAE